MTPPWRPMCAVCVLCGIRNLAADTIVGGTPVCIDHADLLATHGLLEAVEIAREDLTR